MTLRDDVFDFLTSEETGYSLDGDFIGVGSPDPDDYFRDEGLTLRHRIGIPRVSNTTDMWGGPTARVNYAADHPMGRV